MSRPHDPITLRSVTAPNRLWLSPMCQYSAARTGPDVGKVTDWHVGHLQARAVGGFGLIMTEATAIDAVGRVSPADLGIWADDQVDGLSRIADAVRSQGVIPAIQLGHAGAKGSTCEPWNDRRRRVPESEGGWIPWSPSPHPDGLDVHEPTRSELDAIPGFFAAAARRAARAGFLLAEIHAAHGYLLHSFLSPLTNTRSDEYGRDRSRLLREVIGAVREEWPEELPLSVRLSASDWLDGGLTVDDAIEVTREIRALGIDFIDVSSGGLRPAVIETFPGYQVPFAAAIRQHTDALVGAVGLIDESEHVRQILSEGIDVVLAGRAALRDPNWARKVLADTGEPATWPQQYAWALGPRG